MEMSEHMGKQMFWFNLSCLDAKKCRSSGKAHHLQLLECRDSLLQLAKTKQSSLMVHALKINLL